MKTNRRELLKEGLTASVAAAIPALAAASDATPRPTMEVGALEGCMGQPVNMGVACDLSYSTLMFAIAKFPIKKRGSLWLRVPQTTLEFARELVYGYSIARGMDRPVVQIAVDEEFPLSTVWNPPVKIGWLVSDGLPAHAKPVPMAYTFPTHVRLGDGRVIALEED